MIRVGIVEGNALLAQAWDYAINRLAGLTTAWGARTVEEARSLLRETAPAPEVLLLGIDAPGREGLEGPDLPPVVSLSLRSGPATTEALRRALLDAAAGERGALAADAALAGVLTARERQVLKLVARGKRSREIAASLEISHKTVDTHRLRVLAKLGLRNNSELIRYAIGRGYVGL